RTDQRKGNAYGYKPIKVKTRVGEITFAILQVREGSFYSSTLVKGMRSESAFTMILSEMCNQSVST
ncbi:MAG: transposase, partial [Anaerolineaceae bacterium]|nr:transposase [Anaerolineaceae bacterium]